MNSGPWNSLEVAKLLAGLLTPAALALFGIYIHRVTKRFEHLQWRSQKLVEKRLAIYDDLAPQLNDLLCYFTYVGVWKELDPPRVVSLKREIDKKIHLAAPLFTESFFRACTEFLSLCFETPVGAKMLDFVRNSSDGNRPDQTTGRTAGRAVSATPNRIRKRSEMLTRL